MIGELDLDGLFVSPALASGAIAFLIFIVVRRLLVRSRIYRFIWHAPVFDGAAFVILWAAVAALPLLSWS